jgi:hypothetical protein
MARWLQSTQLYIPSGDYVDINAFNSFVADFMNESDRASIVLGAAQIDVLLEQILSKRLIGQTKDMLDFNGSLGTFSARIDMARATGVIDVGFASALHIIRRIRNSCAHSISNINLHQAPVSDQIRELCNFYANSAYWNESLVSAEEAFGKSGNPLKLRVAIAFLIANLSILVSSVERIQSSSSVSIVIPTGKRQAGTAHAHIGDSEG